MIAIPTFEARHKFFKAVLERFSERDAPDWLTGSKTVPGSTMDCRWFWRDHVLALQVGASVETDFWVITRKS